MPDKAPAFQFYIKEWRSSRAVQRMSYAERGMYLEMLIEQADKGSLPDCPATCADLLGGSRDDWMAAWPTLRRNFVVRRSRSEDVEARKYDPDREIVNLRMSRALRERRAFLLKQKLSGQRGGRASAYKRQKVQALSLERASMVATAVLNPATASASSSPSASASLTTPQVDAIRIRWFVDRYGELYRQFCGVDYIGNPRSDYEECQLFVPRYVDDELDRLMAYWFNSDDKFTRDGTRTIAKFRSRISGMQQELQAKKLWTASSAATKVS
jgi:hypothetical protein